MYCVEVNCTDEGCTFEHSSCADSVLRLHFETGQSHQKRIYWMRTWHTVTSVTSSKLYKLNKKFSRHNTSVITRIERFPLVVSPIVKLRVEGPALLLPEAPPSCRTFLEDAAMVGEPLQYTCKDGAFTALTVQINSF